jgi:hypothetical protein
VRSGHGWARPAQEGSGGSADAILRGLGEESEALQSARADEARRRVDLVRDSYSRKRRDSLLDFSSRWLSAGSSALGGTQRRRSLLD